MSSMEDTYHFDDTSEREEGREAMSEIDAFEARLRGEAPKKTAGANPLQARDNKPKAANPSKKGASYVQSAVKPPKMTEAQQEAEEAKSAVADLAKFEERFS